MPSDVLMINAVMITKLDKIFCQNGVIYINNSEYIFADRIT